MSDSFEAYNSMYSDYSDYSEDSENEDSVIVFEGPDGYIRRLDLSGLEVFHPDLVYDFAPVPICKVTEDQVITLFKGPVQVCGTGGVPIYIGDDGNYLWYSVEDETWYPLEDPEKLWFYGLPIPRDFIKEALEDQELLSNSSVSEDFKGVLRDLVF